MWDLPGPGIEPVSPALAGRFLTTAPPGRSLQRRFQTGSLKGELREKKAVLVDYTWEMETIFTACRGFAMFLYINIFGPLSILGPLISHFLFF